MKLIDEYSAALVSGDTETCVEIELAYGLYGFPPELVSVGLVALDAGGSAQVAIANYLQAEIIRGNNENP